MFGAFVVMPLGLLGGLRPWEVIIIGIVALLLYGKRLPEVAKSAGKAIVEFKKGLRGVKDDIEESDEEASCGDDTPPEKKQE